MIKTEFIFGEEILVTGSIIRSKLPNHKREWYRTKHPPRKALFLFAMNLSNVTVEVENHGQEGYDQYFDHKEYIKGAWICEKNRKPRKVFLSDCHKVNQ